uniref:Uncharacterized protein n=1 Tax=Oryza rufipogon TaxID=4529 RepID=A0A0E0P5J9_ORYRU
MAMAERDERRSGRQWPDFNLRLTRYTSAVGQDKDGSHVANDGGHATNGSDRDEGGDGRGKRRRASRATAAVRWTQQMAATEPNDGGHAVDVADGGDRAGRLAVWRTRLRRRPRGTNAARRRKPICRTVSDAVHVLDNIVGYDALDAEATGASSKYIPPGGYGHFLRMDGLKGKRIGIPNGFFTKEKYGKKQLMVYQKHVALMREHGAMVIENIGTTENQTEVKNHLFEIDLVAMKAEFKLSLNAYLSDLLYSPVRSLADVIAFNNAHPVEERLKDFGQSFLTDSQKTNGIGPREKTVLKILKEISTDVLEKLMKKHQLDAIVTPNSDASTIFAIGGMPAIAVPAGYDNQGVPFAICFGGLKGYEPRLIEMAYAFEQATKVRRMPRYKH